MLSYEFNMIPKYRRE